MRVLALLVTLGLAASAWYAPKIKAKRVAARIGHDLIVPAPRDRIQIGIRERALGLQLAGYDELIANGEDDAEFYRGRIRVGFQLGATVIGHEGLSKLVQLQVQDYLEHQERIDPDGSFLRRVMRGWIDSQLSDQSAFYRRVSVLMFQVAKHDKKALADLLDYTRQGPFFSQYFPFARIHAVSWTAVEPLVKHYFADGKLEAVVEAGYTLLWYESVYGVGTELLDRHLDDVREALKEIRAKLRAPNRNNHILLGSGIAGIRAMALLAMRGDADFIKILENAQPVEMPYHVKHLRAAKVVIGADAWPRPGQKHFDRLDPELQDFLFRTAAAHAGLLRRQLQAGHDPVLADRLAATLKFARAGYQSAGALMRSTLLLVLHRHGTESDRSELDEAFKAGGYPSLYASCVRPPQNPARVYLPAMNAPGIWPPAMAAVNLAYEDPSPVFQR